MAWASAYERELARLEQPAWLRPRHVGLGSDFDGILRRPQGLEDASCYPTLADGLARRGFDPTEVDGILGGNMHRVFARATGPGTRAHGADLTPIDQPN